MKAQSIFLSVIVLFIAFTANAQTAVKKETIKVWGNCGMCKKLIEKSAMTAGAKSAEWNTETKVLSLVYDAKVTSSKKIQESVAATGYDTQDVTASKAAYDKLHECCKYDRKQPDSTATKKEEKSCCEGNDKACCKDGKKEGSCSKEGEKEGTLPKKHH